MSAFFYKSIYFLRFKTINFWLKILRTFYYRMMGLKAAKGTLLPKVGINWPHQVQFGSNCLIEKGSSFKFIGIYKHGPNLIFGNHVFLGENLEFNIQRKIIVSDNCLIGSGCKFIDHDHGISANTIIRAQKGKEGQIILEEDVWLGSNVIVLKDVTIGKGAVIGANSIVNQSIPSFEIWAGSPVRRIGIRD